MPQFIARAYFAKDHFLEYQVTAEDFRSACEDATSRLAQRDHEGTDRAHVSNDDGFHVFSLRVSCITRFCRRLPKAISPTKH